MNLFKDWVSNMGAKTILFCLLVPNMILFFLPVANEEMAASYYGIETNDIQYMVSLYYVGFASFYSLERRFYSYFTSKQYFMIFQILQLICCYILFASDQVFILYGVRFFQGMLFASSVNLYMSLVFKTMKSFRAKEMTFSMFFGMLLCTGSFNNLITADVLDNFSFGFIYQCSIVMYGLAILLVLITMRRNVFVKGIPLIRLDFGSFILLATALMSAGYLSVYGQQYYWFQNKLIALVFGIFMIASVLFVIRQLNLKRPYISMKIFRVKQYWWGIVLLYLMYIERFSFAYSGSFYKSILKMDPRHVSYMFAFNIAGIVLGVACAAWWLIKKKPVIFLWIAGFMSLFVYHFMMRFLMYGSGNEYYYFFPMMMHGLGVGLIMVPTILHCVGVVPYYIAPSAAAFCLIVRFAGYTTSNLLTKYFTLYNYNVHYSKFLEDVTQENSMYNQRLIQVQGYLKDRGLESSSMGSVSQKMMRSMLDKEILMRSIMDYYTMMMYMSIIILFAIFFYWLGHKNYKIIFRPLSPV